MIELGFYSILTSMLLCAYGLVASLWGGRNSNLPLIRSAENAVYANFALLSVASVSLIYLFLTDTFVVQYVANYRASAYPSSR